MNGEWAVNLNLNPSPSFRESLPEMGLCGAGLALAIIGGLGLFASLYKGGVLLPQSVTFGIASVGLGSGLILIALGSVLHFIRRCDAKVKAPGTSLKPTRGLALPEVSLTELFPGGNLPPEIVEQITKYLNFRALLGLSLLSKTWFTFTATCTSIWKPYSIRDSFVDGVSCREQVIEDWKKIDSGELFKGEYQKSGGEKTKDYLLEIILPKRTSSKIVLKITPGPTLTQFNVLEMLEASERGEDLFVLDDTKVIPIRHPSSSNEFSLDRGRLAYLEDAHSCRIEDLENGSIVQIEDQNQTFSCLTQFREKLFLGAQESILVFSAKGEFEASLPLDTPPCTLHVDATGIVCRHVAPAITLFNSRFEKTGIISIKSPTFPYLVTKDEVLIKKDLNTLCSIDRRSPKSQLRVLSNKFSSCLRAAWGDVVIFENNKELIFYNLKKRELLSKIPVQGNGSVEIRENEVCVLEYNSENAEENLFTTLTTYRW